MWPALWPPSLASVHLARPAGPPEAAHPTRAPARPNRTFAPRARAPYGAVRDRKEPRPW
ncbi:hypothetical protein B0H12DRAFT_1116487 [Mycena haematopus]|nr:hypothetical protein B0H12DRAFT_1116487 [Mycena haematopus]